MSRKKIIALIESGIPLKSVSDNKENKKLLESISKEELMSAQSITLEGKCMDFKEMSENDRFYNREEFLVEFNRLAEVAKAGQLFASADHPEDDEEFIVKSGKIAGIIDELWYVEEEDSCYIRLRLIPTIVGGGKDLMVVVANGGVLCVSLRALGYVEEETKEAFVDTMYTFDVVAMPGIKSAKQRVVDFETGKILTEAKLVSMFESANQNPKLIENENGEINIEDLDVDSDVSVALDTNTIATMQLTKKPWKNKGILVSVASLNNGELYEIAYNEANKVWELDEDDHNGLLTEAINSKKSKQMARTKNVKVTSLKRVTEGRFNNAPKFRRLFESDNLNDSEIEGTDADQEDMNLVGSAISAGGDDNFEVLAENENGEALIQDKENGDIFVAGLTENKKRIAKIAKLKENFSIGKAKRLIESGEGGIPTETEDSALLPSVVSAIQEAIDGSGDGTFEVLAENENGEALVQDVNSNDVYMAVPEDSKAIVEEIEEEKPIGLVESVKKTARLKEAFAGKKISGVRRFKENVSTEQAKEILESEDAEIIEASTEPVELSETEMNVLGEKIAENDNLELVAENEDSIAVADDATDTTYIVEVEDEKSPLTESRKRRVKSVRKLKENRKAKLTKRLFESEGVAGVEDSMEDVEFDNEDLALVQEAIDGETDKLEVVAENEDAVMLEDADGEIYLAETEDVVESPLLEAVKRKKQLKEAFKGKRIIGFMRFKENVSKAGVKKMFEAEDADAILSATEEMPITEEESEDLKSGIQSQALDLNVIAESEDSVVLEDQDSGEMVVVGTSPLTESVKTVKTIKKFKESGKATLDKASRLLESGESIDTVLEEVETDEEDLALVEEVLNGEDDHNMEVVVENENDAIITDKDTGETFLVETETEEIPIPEISMEEKNQILEEKIARMSEKLDEVVDETNRISEFCEDSSEAISLMESSNRRKVIKVLAESKKVDIFAKKRQRILESAPIMKMYENDDEVLMAFDGADEDKKSEILEAVELLDRDSLLQEMRNK